MKNIKSLSLFAIALVAVFGVTVGYTNAQTSGGGGGGSGSGSVTCPAGYVCTPVIPPAPPATTTPPFPVPTSDATVRVIGSPTLELTYDANRKESLLTATFNVSVIAVSQGINIYSIGGGATFTDQSWNVTRGNSISPGMVTAISPSVVAGDSPTGSGSSYFVVPAGTSRTFQVIVTVKPQELFAGTYHSSLISLFANASTGIINSFNLQVPSNQTNSKTIIGELSPYITGFGSTQPFTPGQSIVVQGQRLDTTGGVFIDGVFITSGVKGDSSNIGFALPTSLANGYHTLQIKSNTTGASNNVSFQVQSSVTPCYNFTVNLQIGSTGPDVSALQRFLTSKGFSTEVSGYFGKSTYSALMSYQTSVGIPATGFLGPLTRAEVNASCGSVPVAPSITVLSPNSGQNYQAGNTMYISWNGGYGTDHIVIDLLQAAGNSYLPVSGSSRVNINNNAGSYSLTIPSVTTASNYVIGVGVLDTSTGIMTSYGYSGLFTITSSTSKNLPPVISGGTFPISLKVNETGTWTVKASDPENGPLSYSVDWGDQPTTVPCLPGRICEMTKKIVQTSSFTHSYSTAGTYTVKFTVQDNAGQTAQTSATVKVDGGVTATQCGITAQVTNTYLASNNTSWGFYVTVNATNPPVTSSGWTTNFEGYTPQITSYGVTKLYGNFFLSSGPLQFTPRDQVNNSCSTTITVYPPIPSTTQPLTASSISFVNGQSTYTSGQQIKVSVKGIASDGSSPGSEKGFNVQAYMQDAYSGVIVQVNGVNQGFNATYNTSTKYWDIAMTAPSDTSKSYVIAASFYCSNYSSACSQGQVDQRLPFTITSPAPVFCPAGYICTPGTPTTPQPVNCPSGYICTIPSVTPPPVTPPTPVKSLTFNTTGLGSTYHVGDSIPIKWSSTGVSNVVIDLYDYKGSTKVRNITTIGAPKGEYNWTVPTDISTNNTYTIRISDDQATLRQTSSKIDLVPVLVVPVTVLPWTVATTTVLTGKPLSYTLNWSGGPMDQSWSTFEHFVKSDNPNIMFGDGFWPSPATTQWSGNISTTRTFTVPANTPPGTYKVMVGLYNASRVTTLVAGSGVTVDNQYRYQVGTITVTAPIQQTTSVWDAFKSLFGF